MVSDSDNYSRLVTDRSNPPVLLGAPLARTHSLLRRCAAAVAPSPPRSAAAPSLSSSQCVVQWCCGCFSFWFVFFFCFFVFCFFFVFSFFCFVFFLYFFFFFFCFFLFVFLCSLFFSLLPPLLQPLRSRGREWNHQPHRTKTQRLSRKPSTTALSAPSIESTRLQ